jgi:cytochrome b561
MSLVELTECSIARYTRTAMALHWVAAALITAGFTLGLSMVGLPVSPQKLKWYSWHKWIGITVFLVVIARLLWRQNHPAPPLPASVARWERRIARITHIALYVLMLVIPLSGWAYSSAAGVPVVYLGLVPLPNLVHRDEALADLLRLVHRTWNFTLLGLVALHVVAALKHQFLDHDRVLARMLPAKAKV